MTIRRFTAFKAQTSKECCNLRRFPGMPIITLDTSYRSVQPILDAAALLINNADRLVGKVPESRKYSFGLVPPEGCFTDSHTTGIRCRRTALPLPRKLKIYEQGIDYSEIAIFTYKPRTLSDSRNALGGLVFRRKLPASWICSSSRKSVKRLRCSKQSTKPTEDSFLGRTQHSLTRLPPEPTLALCGLEPRRKIIRKMRRNPRRPLLRFSCRSRKTEPKHWYCEIQMHYCVPRSHSHAA